MEGVPTVAPFGLKLDPLGTPGPVNQCVWTRDQTSNPVWKSLQTFGLKLEDANVLTQAGLKKTLFNLIQSL